MQSVCRLLAVQLCRLAAGRTEEGRYPQGGRGGIGDDQRAPARNCWRFGRPDGIEQYQDQIYRAIQQGRLFRPLCLLWHPGIRHVSGDERSEEHTSELQSLMRISYAVFCLKKKKKDNN